MFTPLENKPLRATTLALMDSVPTHPSYTRDSSRGTIYLEPIPELHDGIPLLRRGYGNGKAPGLLFRSNIFEDANSRGPIAGREATDLEPFEEIDIDRPIPATLRALAEGVEIGKGKLILYRKRDQIS